MNPESIDIELALRTPEESADLGLQLLRRNAGRALGAVVVTMTPVWALLLVLGELHPSFVLLGIWWTKPLLDRVVLYVLSRATFGEAPSIRRTVIAFPSFFDRTLLLGLTLLRFQVRRSLWMPVAVLEGLRGRALRDRFAELNARGTATNALMQTFVWIHIEFALASTLPFVIWSFLPESVQPPLTSFLELDGAQSALQVWINRLSYIPILVVIEACYVASGFGLYLSRRTELEGWDVQLAFQRMGARLAAVARRGLAIALLFAVALVGLAPAAGAQQGDSPAEVAREILAGPDFETTRSTETWMLDVEGGSGFSFGPLLAFWAQVLGWTLLAVIVGYLLVQLAKRAEIAAAPAHERRPNAPAEAFGLDLTEESLPADIAGEAEALARAGKAVAALSLLYRGALARLIERERLVIEPGDTEHDCMRRVERELGAEHPTVATDFGALTRSWLDAAWGGRTPETAVVLVHCDAWRRSFERREKAA